MSVSEHFLLQTDITTLTSRLCSSSTDVLRFDNTYSIFQAKRISFTVEVLLPDRLQPPQSNGGAGSNSVQAKGPQPTADSQS